MKTLLKIGLIVVAVVVAIELLPAALVLGGVVAGGGGAVGAGRLPDDLRLLGAGLLTLLLTPIWLPVLAGHGAHRAGQKAMRPDGRGLSGDFRADGWSRGGFGGGRGCQ